MAAVMRRDGVRVSRAEVGGRLGGRPSDPGAGMKEVAVEARGGEIRRVVRIQSAGPWLFERGVK